jgi:hypothetical protein
VKSIIARAPLIFFFRGLVVMSDGRAEDYYVDYHPDGMLVISSKKPPPKSKIIRQWDLATVPQAQDSGGAQPKVQSEASDKPFKSKWIQRYQGTSATGV